MARPTEEVERFTDKAVEKAAKVGQFGIPRDQDLKNLAEAVGNLSRAVTFLGKGLRATYIKLEAVEANVRGQRQ